VEFRVLGPLEVAQGGEPVVLRGAKERVLLVRLLISANRVVSLDTIIEDLWGPDSPEEAAATVRVYVSRLRKHLRQHGGDDLIRTQPPGYLLAVDTKDVDAWRFEELAGEAREALRRGDTRQAGVSARQALGLWRGPALGDGAGYAFAQLEASRLTELHRAAVEDRIEADLECGGHVDVVGELTSLVEANPYRERLWRLYMLALYRSGRQAEALRAYQRVRTLLAENLGIAPSQELVDLERDILMQAPALSAQTPSAGTPVVRRPEPAEPAPAPAPPPRRPVRAVLHLRPSPSLGRFPPEHLALCRLRATEWDAIDSLVEVNEDEMVIVLDDPWTALTDISAAFAAFVPGRLLDFVCGGLHGEASTEVDAMRAEAASMLHVVARRLSEAAPPGHILISPSLARLARTAGLRVRPADVEPGAVSFAGTSEESDLDPLFELELEAVRPDPALELLPVARTGPFVGRSAELDTLTRRWEVVVGSQLSCAVVLGEPGIGKTRVLRELASVVWEDGGIVLTGRCDEGAVVPFQPLVSAAAQYLDRRGATECPAWSLPGAAELAALLPRPLAPETLPERVEADATTQRYWLFEAFFSVFEQAAHQAPTLLVIDDLQWADLSTVRLLCHIAERGGHLPLFVVVSCRVSGREQVPALAELRRVVPLCDVALQGLPSEQIRQLVVEWTKRAPSAAALAELEQETGGNPFFIGELLATAGEADVTAPRRRPVPGSGPVNVPEGVMALVGRRVDRLAASAREFLEAASVVGRSFRLDVIEAVCTLDDETLSEAIDATVDAGLVEEDAGRGPGNYLFSHTLIQRGVYEQMGPGRRLQLHKRIGNFFFGRFGVAPGPHLAEMARHLVLGQVGTEDRERALAAVLAAGREALEHLAHEEAAAYFGAGLTLLDERSVDASDRVGLLLDLAEAWSRAGQLAEARAVLQEAEGVARRARLDELFARVVLAQMREPWGLGFTLHEGERAGQLTAALSGLSDEPRHDALRAALLVYQGIDFYVGGDQAASRRAAEQAVSLGASSGDPALAYLGRVALLLSELGPDLDPVEQEHRTDELMAQARELPEAAADLSVRQLRLNALLHQGDTRRFAADVRHLGEVARARSLPTYDYWWRVYRSTEAYLAGRLSDAEATAVEAFAAGQRINESTAVAVFGAQMILVLWARGSLGSILDSAGSLADQFRRVAVFRAALAFMHCEAGDDEGRMLFDSFADADFDNLPRTDNWLAGMFMLSLCSDRLEERDAAAVLADMLVPYRHRAVATAAGVVFLGSAALPLGVAARTAGRLAEADAALAEAVAANRAMGSRPMEVLSLCEHARGRLALGDAPGARRLRAEATALAERLDLPGLLRVPGHERQGTKR
jgi:DNA-binding SARP family transcriptional activator